MAFPAIESISPASDNATGGAVTTGSTAATSHAVVLPATITAGSLLMVFGRVIGSQTAIAVTGGGWTIVQDTSDAATAVSFIMWKSTLAVGNEDATSITVTHGSGKMTAIALSITGAPDPALMPPVLSTVAVGTGTGVDPTTCSPGYGTKDFLWLWAGVWSGEQTTPLGSNPTNYSSNKKWETTGTVGTTTTNGQCALATRNANGSTEDAGSWTISTAPAGWTAWVVGIQQAVAQKTVTPAYGMQGAVSKSLALTYNVAKATGVAQISLAGLSTPETRTLHAIYVKARVTSGSGGKIRVALYEGSNNRISGVGYLETTSLTNALAEYTLSIGDADAANITDYSNLELRVTGYNDSGSSKTFEISEVRMETPAAGGVTSVSKDLALTYNVVGRVSKALALSYTVRQVISKTLTPAYTVRERVFRNLGPQYWIIGRVSAKNLALSYTVRKAVTKTVTPAYEIFQGIFSISFSETFAYWVGYPTARLTVNYNISGAAVTKALALTYNVRASVSKALALTYAVKQSIAKALALTYNILTTSAQTGTARVSLAALNRPSPQVSHLIRVRARMVSGTGTIRAALYDGNTNITGTLESSALTASLADYVLNIPDGVAANITQYDDLELRLWGWSTSGAGAQFEVAAIELQVPVGLANVQKTLAPSYNVRVSVSKTLTPNYTVRAAVVKTVTPSYNVRTSVSKTLTPSYNITGSSTAVSKALALSYNVRASASKALALSYAVKVVVSKALALSYSVVGRVSKALSVSYNILSSVSQTGVARLSLPPTNRPSPQVNHKINIRARATSGSGTRTMRVALYDGNTNITGTLETTALTGSLANYVVTIPDGSAANITQYDDLELRLWGFDADGGATAFEVAEINLEVPLGLANVKKTLTPTYNVRKSVSKALALSYNITDTTPVSKALSLSYGIAGRVSKALALSYYVVAIGPRGLNNLWVGPDSVSVSKALSLTYSIAGKVTKPLALTYNVRVVVSKTLTPTYTVKKSISKPLALTYNIGSGVSKSLSLSYAIAGKVTKPISLTYNVRVIVSKTITPSYTVKRAVAKTVTPTYNVRVTASKTLTPTYNVRKVVSKAQAFSYNISSFSTVIKALSPSYTIRTSTSKTLTPTYFVRKTVSKPLALSYNISAPLQSVTKSLSVTYLIFGPVVATLTISYFVIERPQPVGIELIRAYEGIMFNRYRCTITTRRFDQSNLYVEFKTLAVRRWEVGALSTRN